MTTAPDATFQGKAPVTANCTLEVIDWRALYLGGRGSSMAGGAPAACIRRMGGLL